MLDPQDFNVGDVVQMRSGGPFMTVREARPESVACAWFDAQNIEREAEFKPEMLMKPVLGPEASRRVIRAPYSWMRQSG